MAINRYVEIVREEVLTVKRERRSKRPYGERLTICGRRLHLLDHVHDREANPRVGDPQECPDEPRALPGIIGS